MEAQRRYLTQPRGSGRTYWQGWGEIPNSGSFSYQTSGKGIQMTVVLGIGHWWSWPFPSIQALPSPMETGGRPLESILFKFCATSAWGRGPLRSGSWKKATSCWRSFGKLKVRFPACSPYPSFISSLLRGSGQPHSIAWV